MGDDLERWDREWRLGRGRVSRYLAVRRAIHARIDELDERIVELLADLDRADRRLQEEFERNPKGLGFRRASHNRGVVSRALEESFAQMASLESGLQRRWSRYTAWIPLALSVVALIVSLVK